MELSARQEKILSLIIRGYVKTPAPISSKAVVEDYDLDVSSATVRNDMAALEEAGLIISPHTSAGRIPTEEGYRYYVRHLGEGAALTTPEKRSIGKEFRQVERSIEKWLRLAATVLARTANSASLVTSPRMVQTRFKHVELVNTQGRQVLMILVLKGGDVRQQMLTLAEPVNQIQLGQTATRINTLCTGVDAEAIRLHAPHQQTLDGEIMELIADLLDRANKHHRIIYHDGLVNILDPSTFLDRLSISDPQEREEIRGLISEVDSAGARQALHLLDEQSLLEEILSDVLSPDAQEVQVMVAGDGRWEALSHTGLIISPYGIDGRARGALGILGPKRMHYGRAISAVRYVAGMMNDLMLDVYDEPEDDLSDHPQD